MFLGYSECIRLLVDYGAWPYARDYRGWTAAHYAAETGKLPACRVSQEYKFIVGVWKCSLCNVGEVVSVTFPGQMSHSAERQMGNECGGCGHGLRTQRLCFLSQTVREMKTSFFLQSWFQRPQILTQRSYKFMEVFNTTYFWKVQPRCSNTSKNHQFCY